MTWARTTPRPVTAPACPNCGEALRPECIRAKRDRRAVRFMRCSCGHQEGHMVQHEEAAA